MYVEKKNCLMLTNETLSSQGYLCRQTQAVIQSV